MPRLRPCHAPGRARQRDGVAALQRNALRGRQGAKIATARPSALRWSKIVPDRAGATALLSEKRALACFLVYVVSHIENTYTPVY